MKITIESNKYKKRMVRLWFGAITIGLVAILVVFMNLFINKKLNFERISVVIGLLILFISFAYMIIFYSSLRKLEHVIIYENGVLNDFSKPFNKAIDLKVENIKSISTWSSNRGINQYKIVTKNYNPKLKGLLNQLKGNHIYLIDYMVDSNELKELAILIEKECLIDQLR